MNIYRIASAKDKIAKYKITDPHLIYFIYSYENLIPWKDIRTADDINAYITSNLLPQLHAKINRDFPKSNYLKNIDVEKEFAANMNNPVFQRAYQLFQQNPEEGKKILLDIYNGEKEKSFKAWWEYLTTQAKYAPSFAYCLFKKMLDVSTETQKAGTYSVQPAIVSMIYNEIAKNPREQVDILGIYKEKNVEIQSAGLEDYDLEKKSGWKRIPSKISDPENFGKNVQTLKDLSLPQGWCTGSFNAVPYLSIGDHWLYLVDGVAKVTIRLVGEGMAEIRGPSNSVATPWGEEVIDFVTKKQFPSNWAYKDHFKELVDTTDLINKKFEKGEIKPEDINFSKYQRLSSSNKARLSEKDKERIAKEWAAAGNIDIHTEIPLEFSHFPFVREAVINAWKRAVRISPEIYDGHDIPRDIKALPEIKQVRLEAWYERMAVNIDSYETAPSDILSDPKIHDKVIEHCISKVEKDPNFYHSLPIGIRRGNDRILKVVDLKLLPDMAEKIVEDPREYETVDYEFIDEPVLKEAFKEGLIELIRRKPQALNTRVCTSSHAAKLEEEIKKSPSMKAELKKAWLEGIQAQQTKKPLPPRDKKSFKPEPPPEENQEKDKTLNASLNWYEKATIKYARK